VQQLSELLLISKLISRQNDVISMYMREGATASRLLGEGVSASYQAAVQALRAMSSRQAAWCQGLNAAAMRCPHNQQGASSC
jgi:hypothetical protein